MEAARAKSRMRIRTIMAAVVLVAVALWGYVEIWPRVRYWWPNRHLFAAMGRPAEIPLAKGATLEDIIKSIKVETKNANLPMGVPIYLDPVGLLEAGQTMGSPLAYDQGGRSLGDSLEKALEAVDLTYYIKDGLVMITSKWARPSDAELRGK